MIVPATHSDGTPNPDAGKIANVPQGKAQRFLNEGYRRATSG